ncbi:polysaccharide pyruvyl transferase family protein, partial [bacterium]|nr:polysaccharide pyruvyl transferase family protein [bacterium]
MPKDGILYLGSYGTGNHGDEALLASARRILGSFRPDASKKVLSRQPGLESLQGFPVIYYGKKSPLKTLVQLIREIRKSEVLVLGGGGLFNDHFPANLFYYGLPVLLARILGCKVLFLGLGFGPFRSALRRRIASDILAMGNGVSLRDEASLRELRGRASKKARLGTDLAWGLEFVEGQEPSPGILLSLRPWKLWPREELLEHVFNLIDGLPSEFPLRLIAMDENMDRAILREVEVAYASRRQVEWIGTDQESIQKAFGTSQWVIAMRYHAALFAARSGAALHV